jgi:hypothetical protein
MENVITKKNSYGETIVIKLEKGIIKVKHSDLDGKFRTLNTFFKNIILSEGTFSWWIGFLSKNSNVFCNYREYKWHGDIFFNKWKQLSEK